MYEQRNYLNQLKSKLQNYNVTVGESDLEIYSTSLDDEIALKKLRKLRSVIQASIGKFPSFHSSLCPVRVDVKEDMIMRMIEASTIADVGPMASVAGCISEEIGRELLKTNDEVIVENGGDIFMSLNEDSKINVFTNSDYFKDRICIELRKELFPIGVCTSSGTMGHSLSFGRADSVTVISKNTYLADALATSLCNRVKSQNDINEVIDIGRDYEGVIGIVIICGDKIGFWGDIKITTS